jgi:hypothetical protein
MESSSGAVNRKLGKEIGDRSFDRIGAGASPVQSSHHLPPRPFSCSQESNFPFPTPSPSRLSLSVHTHAHALLHLLQLQQP